MTTILDDFNSILQVYIQAVWEKDLSAFLALYSADVRVFDTWDRWVYQSKDEWQEMPVNWFKDLGEERVRVTFSEVQVAGDEHLLVGTAFARFAAVDTAGEESRSLTNRLTICLRREDGRWVIFHEHTSSPAGFPDMKVKLQRD